MQSPLIEKTEEYIAKGKHSSGKKIGERLWVVSSSFGSMETQSPWLFISCYKAHCAQDNRPALFEL